MVRNHPDSCSPLAIPGASSCRCPSMEGPSSEARVDGASGSETQQAARAPQPKKKKPEDFKFGKILGEGSFSTVRIPTLDRCLWALIFTPSHGWEWIGCSQAQLGKSVTFLFSFRPKVVLAREQATGKEYASKSPFVEQFLFVMLYFYNGDVFFPTVKILEKRHIIKENKVQYVKRERDLMSILEHPFFVKLFFTFQDDEKLCILSLARQKTASFPTGVMKYATNSIFLWPFCL